MLAPPASNARRREEGAASSPPLSTSTVSASQALPLSSCLFSLVTDSRRTPLRAGGRKRWGGEYGLGLGQTALLSRPVGADPPWIPEKVPRPRGRKGRNQQAMWSKVLLRRGSQACSLGDRDRGGQRATLTRPCTSPLPLIPPLSTLLPSSASRGPRNSRMFLEFKTYHQGFIKDF